MLFALSDDDRFNITALIARYSKVLNTMDIDGIAQIWDRRDGDLYYIAEEVPDPMIGWDAIAAYWALNKQYISRMSMRTGQLHMHAIAADLAIVMFPMHWNAAVGDQTPVGGDVNVTAVLRHTSDGWKFIHYAESALGAFPFLRRVYERAVDPDFLQKK